MTPKITGFLRLIGFELCNELERTFTFKRIKISVWKSKKVTLCWTPPPLMSFPTLTKDDWTKWYDVLFSPVLPPPPSSSASAPPAAGTSGVGTSFIDRSSGAPRPGKSYILLTISRCSFQPLTKMIQFLCCCCCCCCCYKCKSFHSIICRTILSQSCRSRRRPKSQSGMNSIK